MSYVQNHRSYVTIAKSLNSRVVDCTYNYWSNRIRGRVRDMFAKVCKNPYSRRDRDSVATMTEYQQESYSPECDSVFDCISQSQDTSKQNPSQVNPTLNPLYRS